MSFICIANFSYHSHHEYEFLIDLKDNSDGFNLQLYYDDKSFFVSFTPNEVFYIISKNKVD